MKTKVCSAPDCEFSGKPQPIENFYKNEFGKYGRYSICRKCKGLRTRTKYHTNERLREQTKKRVIRYRQTERGKQTEKKSLTNYAKNHPGRIKAREVVNDLVKRKKIPRASELKCSCGKQATQYHHHKGYAKENWLDVIPICNTCHNLIHRKEILT